MVTRVSCFAMAWIVAAAGTCAADESIEAAPVVRPSDTRPKHDDRKLAALGIKLYESKRLKLYTDIDPAIAKSFPAYVDAAHDAWVDYFGPLPPNKERTEFQMTGYLMTSKPLFREAGLIPADLPDFVNGRHRGAEFWMVDQKFDYYRRHLMIHEATHCYMTILGGPLPPVWYMEGMAELFGTHRVETNGKILFRVMPENQTDYGGLGRITFLRQEVAAERGKTLDDVLAIRPTDFLKNDAYAWSWGLCAFLDGHPKYQQRFRLLARNLTYREFQRRFQERFESDSIRLRQEWLLFVRSIQEGFDNERAAVVFREAVKPASSLATSIEILADRGWQSTGVTVEAGAEYEITASGSFTVAKTPKPWISEPQGVSIRYFEGRPLGQMVGCVVPAGLPTRDRKEPDLEGVFGIGRMRKLRPERGGELFLRVNDDWATLEDNSGQVKVTARKLQSPK